jgi:hypothetical protein
LLVRYFNEAQRILTRRAWVIIETGVAPAGLVTLITGKVLYPLHKSVLRVFDATPTTQSAPLGRTDDFSLRNPSPLGADAFDVGAAASIAGVDTTAAGPPYAIASDAGTRTLRVYPAPAAAQQGTKLSLKIARMPICFLSVDEMRGTPEVPDDYHMWLCDYAAGRCLTGPNTSAVAKTEGRIMLKEFDEHVREARQERQRAEMGDSRWAFSSVTAGCR